MNKPVPASAKVLASLAALSLTSLFLGCELPFIGGGGGGSGIGSGHDFGDNDANVVVALGDSITSGNPPGTVPYPSLLSGMIGKTVINAGAGGSTAGGGAGRVGGLLSRYKPGFLLILLGSNDAIHDEPTSSTIAALQAIVQAAKANKTIPVLATLPPVIRGHAAFSGGIDSRNRGIKSLGSQEDVKVANVNGAIGSDPEGLLSEDGLHPNQAGQQRIASAFGNIF